MALIAFLPSTCAVDILVDWSQRSASFHLSALPIGDRPHALVGRPLHPGAVQQACGAIPGSARRLVNIIHNAVKYTPVGGTISVTVQRDGAERVFVEVTAHHLTLATERILPPDDNRFKVNPPLRAEAERAALFARLADGIDGLGSDHAPHTLAEKAQPYAQAPSGIPGVEYQFPLALTWWRKGVFSLQRLIDLTSGNVSRFFGLNKGGIESGKDGDLVLVDPEAYWTVGGNGDQVASKCGWTLYGGMAMHGRVETTIVAGRAAWTRATGWTDPDRPEARGGTPGSGGKPHAHGRDACCD